MYLFSSLDHPREPFHPLMNELPKSNFLQRGNALHKVTPSQKTEGTLSVTRRELIGWPGLKYDGGEDLPDFLKMGQRDVHEVDRSLLAMAIREEAILSDYRLPTLVLGFGLWSDSCDPNSSMGKNNRGSVWALLLTLCCKVANVNPFSYTYLLSVGSSVSCTNLCCEFQP